MDRELIVALLESVIETGVIGADDISKILVETMHAFDLEQLLYAIQARIRRGDYPEGAGYEGWQMEMSR